ncbi:MAG: Rho termination protein [Ruminococcus sp.]|nr:Rho termination protein [Ruminococcus sp.]
MYRVIQFFTDLQDNDYPYHVGDTFPRGGIGTTDGRLAELSGHENKQRTPLIEFVKEDKEPEGGEENIESPVPETLQDSITKKAEAKTSKK